MAEFLSEAARTFEVKKDDGSHWLLRYTSDGVRWVPGAERKTSSPPISGPAVLPLGPGGKLALALDAVSSIADVWERRQLRLAERAAIEEARQTEWLADIIGRWGNAHAVGTGIDLRVSEYVAREARATMDLLLKERKVALPQSMLYELSTIQETLRTYRELLSAQFALAGEFPFPAIRQAVTASLPGHSLNMNFIQQLGADPEAEWVAPSSPDLKAPRHQAGVIPPADQATLLDAN